MKKWFPVIIVCSIFWWMSVATSIEDKFIDLPACQVLLYNYMGNNSFPELRSFNSIFYDGLVDTFMLQTSTPLSTLKMDSLNKDFCKIYSDSCSAVKLTVAYVDSATGYSSPRNFSRGYAYRFYSCP